MGADVSPRSDFLSLEIWIIHDLRWFVRSPAGNFLWRVRQKGSLSLGGLLLRFSLSLYFSEGVSSAQGMAGTMEAASMPPWLNVCLISACLDESWRRLWMNIDKGQYDGETKPVSLQKDWAAAKSGRASVLPGISCKILVTGSWFLRPKATNLTLVDQYNISSCLDSLFQTAKSQYGRFLCIFSSGMILPMCTFECITS